MNHPGYYGTTIAEEREQAFLDDLCDKYEFLIEREDHEDGPVYVAVIRSIKTKDIIISYDSNSSEQEAAAWEDRCWSRLADLAKEI